MTAERDGKSGRTGQPDLLASLPDERQVPGIDPTAFEKLLTEVQDLRNDFAGLKEAVSAEGSAPVTLDDLREQFAGLREAEPTERPAAVTQEALEAWGDKLVARVAEAARPADVPGDEAAATRNKRMEDAAEKAAAAAARIDGGLASAADQVATEIEGAVTTMNEGLAKTRAANRTEARLADPILEDIRTQTAGLRFGLRTVLVGLIVLVFGMLIESRIHVLYGWLWSG